MNEGKNDHLDNKQVLRAVASWIAYNDLLTTNKIMSEWLSSGSITTASQYQSNIKQPLRQLLSLAIENDMTQVDAVGRTIFHLCLQGMPEASRYSVKDMKNDALLVKTLCEMGASIIIEDNNENTPLGIAVQEKRMDLAVAMVQYSIGNVNECNGHGNNILHILLKNKNYGKSKRRKQFLDIIDKVVSKGVELNKFNHEGLAPIHLTAKSINIKMLEELASRGFDWNYRTRCGNNLLILACQSRSNHTHSDDRELINWLSKHSFNFNSKNNDGFTAVHYAAQLGKLYMIKALKQAGADVHAVSQDGTNPLNLATQHACYAVMKYLIECGVPFNRRNILHGAMLMHRLKQNSSSGDEEAIEWLFKYGFDKNEDGGLTLLHLAAVLGYAKIVKILIDRGFDVHAKDEIFQYTPLHLASIRRQFANVSELRDAGLVYGKIGSDFDSLYFRTYESATMGFYEQKNHVDYESTVLALLEAGAEVNAKDHCGRTPLHYAARHTDENDLIVLLLQTGAQIDELDSEDLLPLHNSLLSANDRGLMYLLSFGADINDINHPYRDICNEIKGLSTPGSGIHSYLIKLQLAGLPINSLYRLYFEDKKCKEHYKDYFKELQVLKKRMVTSNISLYHWLHLSMNGQFTLIKNLPSNAENVFQHFGIVIQNLRYQAINRKPLVEPAKMALVLLTGWHWPDLCIEYIFSFLNNRALIFLIDSVRINES